MWNVTIQICALWFEKINTRLGKYIYEKTMQGTAFENSVEVFERNLANCLNLLRYDWMKAECWKCVLSREWCDH